MNGVSQRSFSLVYSDKTVIVMLIFMLLYCLESGLGFSCSYQS